MRNAVSFASSRFFVCFFFGLLDFFFFAMFRMMHKSQLSFNPLKESNSHTTQLGTCFRRWFSLWYHDSPRTRFRCRITRSDAE